MKKTLLLSLALLVAAAAPAVESLTFKSAVGNNPTVYFPANSSPLRLVSMDVTGSNAAAVLNLAAGTTKYAAVKAALSTATNVVIAKSATPASNDVCLVQTTAGAVTAATVWTNTYSTNKVIPFLRPVGTNLAVGDQLRERGATAYTVQARVAADATNLYLNTTNGLGATDIVVLHSGGNRLLTNTISAIATNSRWRFSLNSPVAYPITIGDTIYALMTNKCVVSGVTASDGVSIKVATTNGFAAADVIYIATTRGLGVIRTIDTAGVSTTNITVSVAPGFALASGDLIYKVVSKATAIYPANIGDATLLVSTNYTLALNTNIVVNSTGYQPWVSKLAAAGTEVAAQVITLDRTFGVVIEPGAVLYEASGTALTTTFAADQQDQSVICNVATGLAAGEVVYVCPATGAGVVFERTVSATPTDYNLSTVTFTGQIGGALAVGESFYLLGSATSLPIGAATVRRDNAVGFWGAPAGVPVRAVLADTNCTIHNVTGLYKP